MKNYQPKDVEDILPGGEGMKIYSDTMKAIGSRYAEFVNKFPEYYNAVYSINQYTVMQDFLISLLKGNDAIEARFKKQVWMQYAKTLQRAVDNIGMVIFFGTTDKGIAAMEALLDPMRDFRIEKIRQITVATNDKMDKWEKGKNGPAERYKKTLREFVAQYTGKKAKQGLRDEIPTDSGDADADASEQTGDAASINE
jgi:hypothetical protein